MVNCFLLKLSQVKALVHIVFIISLELVVYSFPLDVEGNCLECNEEYTSLTPSGHVSKPSLGRRHWCAVFKQFQRCVRPLEVKCRPNLNFQAGRSLVTNHMKNYGCNSLYLTWNETLDIISELKHRQARLKDLKRGHYTNPVGNCQRTKYKPKYKICGLFGDPHLRTFDDKRHTCSIRGAWPLFANRHLTVQVTNIPLENSSRATATSKVGEGLRLYCRDYTGVNISKVPVIWPFSLSLRVLNTLSWWVISMECATKIVFFLLVRRDSRL